MSAPEKVRLKRKRTEDPVAQLLLTRAQDIDATPQKRIRYVIQSSQGQTSVLPVQQTTSQSKATANRLFRLRHGPVLKHGRGDVPVFEERSTTEVKRARIEDDRPGIAPQKEPATPFKRPGKGSAVKSQGVVSGMTATSDDKVAALADSMHQFAIEELAKIPRPTTTVKPRLSPAQARSRHDRSLASSRTTSIAASSPRPQVDDDEFVYDTYILMPASDAMDVDENVGLLVIDEQDDDYWHELLAQQEAEEQESGDEDENAEDHYAADYPEEELASDDEHDAGAYHYRNRAGSDDEQWDHREDSDADSDVYGEQVGFGNKASMIRRWEDELGMRGASHHDYD